MVFEGNSAMPRESAQCTEEDLGYRDGDPHAETVDEVNASGAPYQIGNIGLAKAKNDDLTEWEFLPPILSANCVTDQTERPQFVFKDGKSYLFTISHRGTFAARHRRPRGRLRLRRRRHPQRLPAAERRLGPRARQPDEPQLRRRPAVRTRLQPAPGPLPGVLALRDARRPGAVLHRHDRHARRLRARRHPRADREDRHRRRHDERRLLLRERRARRLGRHPGEPRRQLRRQGASSRTNDGCPGAAGPGASARPAERGAMVSNTAPAPPAQPATRTTRPPPSVVPAEFSSSTV